MVYRLPVIQQDQAHRQMSANDQLDPTSIPVSDDPGNSLRASSSGLVVRTGNPVPITVWVSGHGTDTPSSGQQGQPYKTLDYALTQLSALDHPSVVGLSSSGATYVINLEVGQSYTISTRVPVLGARVILGFYGDSRGDWSTIVEGTPLFMHSDVDRPVLRNLVIEDPDSGFSVASGFVSPQTNVRSEVVLAGLQVSLSDAIGGTWGTVDLIDGPDLQILGTSVNKSNANPLGLLAIRADRRIALRQSGSELLVGGRRMVDPAGAPGVTIPDMVARNNFIHFYLSNSSTSFLPSHVRLNPDALNSANGSGLLDLFWDDTAAIASRRSSYPLLSDVNYGLTNYFTNLRRSSNGRLLNVISGRDF